MFPPQTWSSFKPGVQIAPGSCTGPGQTSMVENAIRNARLYARAGLQVAKSDNPTDRGIFNDVFNEADRATVTTALTNAIEILSKRGQVVVVTCDDLSKRCGAGSPFMYTVIDESQKFSHRDSLAPIVICVSNVTPFPPLPDPCSQLDGNMVVAPKQPELSKGVSQASMLLHELMHVDYISGPSNRRIDDVAYGWYGSHTLRSKDDWAKVYPRELIQAAPTTNADNFIVLCHFGWIAKAQQRKCELNNA